jgi:hypothetical protein
MVNDHGHNLKKADSKQAGVTERSSRSRLYCHGRIMWRLTSRFFLGTFLAAVFTNAVAVYLLHDVDADRVGKLNLAYWELTVEFVAFGLILTVVFFLAAWIGNSVFHLRDVPPKPYACSGPWNCSDSTSISCRICDKETVGRAFRGRFLARLRVIESHRLRRHRTF